MFKSFKSYQELFPNFIAQEIFPLDTSDVLDKLYTIKKEVKLGSKISNQGGYQTLPNLHMLPDFKSLTDSIRSFITDKVKKQVVIDEMWGNINKTYSFNLVHTHCSNKDTLSFFSGVYYLKCNEDTGNIYFHFPQAFYGCTQIRPKQNMMVIFPSYMLHSVGVNQSDQDRVSIAFNFYITENAGGS